MNLKNLMPSEMSLNENFIFFISMVEKFTEDFIYANVMPQNDDFQNMLQNYPLIYKNDIPLELSVLNLDINKRNDYMFRLLHNDLQLIPRRYYEINLFGWRHRVQCRIQHLTELVQQTFISLNIITRCHLFYILKRYDEDVLKFFTPVHEFDTFDYFWFSYPELIDNVWIPGKLITDCGYLNENKK